MRKKDGKFLYQNSIKFDIFFAKKAVGFYLLTFDTQEKP